MRRWLPLSLFATLLIATLLVFQNCAPMATSNEYKGPDPQVDMSRFIELDDMLIDKANISPELAAELEGKTVNPIGQSKAGLLGAKKWPSNVIPVRFHSTFTQSQKDLVFSACAEWEKAGRIRCRPWVSGDSTYLYVTKDNAKGCQSGFGATIGTYTVLNLGETMPVSKSLPQGTCLTKGIAMHELGHALGMIHEHQRPNRNNYLTIHWSNITNGTSNGAYTIISSVNQNSGPYDYESIMHYSRYNSSINGAVTMSAIQTQYNSVIGQAVLSLAKLSAQDMQYIVDVYGAKPVFAVNTIWDYSVVPYKSDMVSTMLTELDYDNALGPKAIAISRSGLGFVSAKSGALTQAEADRLALEGCFAITLGQPCALIVRGTRFTMSVSQLDASFNFSMQSPVVLNADSIPFATNAKREDFIREYLLAASPKAMALALDGSIGWVGNSAAKPVATLAEAQRVALERCELKSAMAPCTLFVSNETLQFNPLNLKWTPRIDYSRTIFGINIPGSRDAVYASVSKIYNNYISSGYKTAMYISSSGSGGYGYSSTQSGANSVALKFCQDNNTTPAEPCFQYLSGASIVFKRGAGQSYSNNLFCKSVPRFDCATHKLMGCTGSLYTTSSGSVAQNTCL